MPILWNQPGLLWSTPSAVWNGESVPTPTKNKGTRMSYIVMNTRDLNDLEIEAKLRNLADAQTENPTAATGLTVTPAALTAAADLIKTKRNLQKTAEAAASSAVVAKNDAVDAGKELIRDYAGEVWTGTGKDPSKCLLLAFDVNDGSSAPPPPPNDGQITGVELESGPNAGELVVTADAKPPRTKSMEVQVNRTPNAAPTWQHEDTFTSTPFTLSNLPSGSMVQVRLRAVFAGNVKGAWSDIAEHRVP